MGKREAAQAIEDAKIAAGKKVKWKTKDGVLETKESAQARSAKLPQLTKHREFDTEKLCLRGIPEEKHGIIGGRSAFQSAGLGILSSAQPFQWHENLISMVPGRHWKDKKNSLKKRAVSMGESQVEEAEEECCTTKASESKHKKVDFDEELAKQSHLN